MGVGWNVFINSEYNSGFGFSDTDYGIRFSEFFCKFYFLESIIRFLTYFFKNEILIF